MSVRRLESRPARLRGRCGRALPGLGPIRNYGPVLVVERRQKKSSSMDSIRSNSASWSNEGMETEVVHDDNINNNTAIGNITTVAAVEEVSTSHSDGLYPQSMVSWADRFNDHSSRTRSVDRSDFVNLGNTIRNEVKGFCAMPLKQSVCGSTTDGGLQRSVSRVVVVGQTIAPQMNVVSNEGIKIDNVNVNVHNVVNNIVRADSDADRIVGQQSGSHAEKFPKVQSKDSSTILSPNSASATSQDEPPSDEVDWWEENSDAMDTSGSVDDTVIQSSSQSLLQRHERNKLYMRKKDLMDQVSNCKNQFEQMFASMRVKFENEMKKFEQEIAGIDEELVSKGEAELNSSDENKRIESSRKSCFPPLQRGGLRVAMKSRPCPQGPAPGSSGAGAIPKAVNKPPQQGKKVQPPVVNVKDSTQGSKKKPMPPIVVRDLLNLDEICDFIDNNVGKNFTTKTYPNGKVHFKTSDEDTYNGIIACLDQAGGHFFTFTPKHLKPKGFMLKGVNAAYDVQRVAEALYEATGFDESSCAVIDIGSANKATSLFKVFLQPGSDLKKLLAVDVLLRCKVSFEPLRGVKVLQCKRCQRLGHVAANCHDDYRCVKCAQSHNPGECAITRESPDDQLKCALCGGQHVASSKKCPKRKASAGARSKGGKKVSAPAKELAATALQAVLEAVSFSQVVKSGAGAASGRGKPQKSSPLGSQGKSDGRHPGDQGRKSTNGAGNKSPGASAGKATGSQSQGSGNVGPSNGAKNQKGAVRKGALKEEITTILKRLGELLERVID